MSSATSWDDRLEQASSAQIIGWISGPELQELQGYALGNELVRRLNQGRLDEVLQILAVPGLKGYLNAFYHSRPDSWWLQDEARWWQLAGALIPHDQLPGFTADCPARSPALSERLQALVEARAAVLRASGTLNHKQIGGIWSSAMHLMYRPGIGREECLQRLDWAKALADECGIRAGSYCGIGWQALLAALPTADQVAIAFAGGKLGEDVLAMNVGRRRDEEPCDWGDWLPYFAAHPDQYRHHMIRDERLIEQYWPLANASERFRLVDRLVELINGYGKNTDMQRVEAVFDRLLADDPAAFADFIQRHGHYDMLAPFASLIWNRQPPALLPLLLTAIAERCESTGFLPSFRTLVQEIVRSQPALLDGVPGGKLVNLLPLLDAELLNQTLDRFTAVIGSSSSKELRRQLTARAGELQPAQLQACGWVSKPAKNLMLTARDVLLAHPDPAVGPLLQQLLASGKLDIGSASQVEARLEELGLRQRIETDDPLALVEARVAGVKRFSAAVENMATDALLALMAPLSAQAGRVLLQLAANAEEELPPLTFQLLEQIPAAQRASLAQQLLEGWIASEGDPKQRWALRLLEGGADDRLVDLLFSTVKAWNKPRRQRAAIAVELLAAIDSPYALMRVQEISESRKFKDTVVEQASLCLRQVAERRGISLQELFDELTPDFGLGAGLLFAIGERSYRVKLLGDLSLQVVDAQGKTSKSLPKPRDAELLPVWKDAAAQLKVLTAGLKTVIQRQTPRLETALITGKQWPLARWQLQFLQHPLLQVIGRSLIWRTDAGQSFRIAEDLSLVDVNDDVVLPEGGSQISLWHPLLAAEGEAEAWRSYLADYELEPVVNQLDAPDCAPGAADVDAHGFVAAQDVKVPQGKLSSLLSKLGYRQGDVIDGPSVEDHYLKIDSLGLRVSLNHGYFPPWMEVENPVEIYGLQVFNYSGDNRHQSLDPASLPPILQATLFDHLKRICALAV